jgi:CRP-like cAMP-binding protein
VTDENHLIKRLPPGARRRLLDICEPIHLARGAVLGEYGAPTRNVYFPTDSYVSLGIYTGGNPALEVGMVGREGMLGAHLALGMPNESLHALVQGPGSAWCIPARAFRREFLRNPALQRCLYRYLYVLMAQMASSAACLRFHLIGPRLARWLLMSHDRAHSDHVCVTQEILAHMLGVRRGAITAAASDLQRSGMIEYSRGAITVLNRVGLEGASCACYTAERRAYSNSFE